MPEFEDVFAGEAVPVVPRRRFRRALLALVAAVLGSVLVGLPLLNGPGFRTLARFGGLKGAAAAGLAGDFRVSGTLWSGFAVHELRLEDADAPGEGRSIRIDELRLSYRAWDLVRNPGGFAWLDSAKLGRTEVRWTLPGPKGEDREEGMDGEGGKGPTGRPTGDFSPLWNLLATEFVVEDLTLLLEQGDRVWSVESLRLDLPGGGAEGSLRLARLSLPGEAALEAVEARLRPGLRSLEIGSLPLLGYADLETLSLAEPRAGEFAAEARLAAAGGKLDLSATLAPEGGLVASLALARQSSLSLEELPLPPEGKLRGAVTDFSLGFSGEPLRPATWELRGKAVASRLGWGAESIDSAILLVEGRRLTMEARCGEAELRLAAEAELEGIETAAGLGRAAARAELEARVPELGATLAAFGLDLPLAGGARIEARDLRFGAGGIETGGLLLETEALGWKEVALSSGRAAVQVERRNFLRFALDLALDEASRTHFAGSIDLGERRYEAGGETFLDASGRLGELLAALGKEGLLGGGASFSWKGTGPLGPGEHGGAASLALEKLSIGGGEPLEGSLLFKYGEGSVRLESLAVKAGTASLSGTGEWNGERLFLPDWSLASGGRRALSLAASLPLGKNEEGGPLDREAPVELELSLDGLEPADLTRIFSAAAPPPGRLDGLVKAAGSLAALDLGGRATFRVERQAETDKSETNPPETNPPETLASCEFSLAGDAFVPATWRVALEAGLSGLSWEGMELERLSLEAATDAEVEGLPLLAYLRFEQSGTLLEGVARLDLGGAKTLADLATAPILADASLEISDAAALVRDFAPSEWKALPLAGSLSASLEGLRLERGSLAAGRFWLGAEGFSFGGEAFEALGLEARVEEPGRVRFEAKVAPDGLSKLAGEGFFVTADRSYGGELTLEADLLKAESRLRRMLSGRPLSELLPGRISLEWSGEGSLADAKHAGSLSLAARQLRLAAGAEPIDAAVEGRYEGATADFPKIELRSAPIQLAGSARWAERELTLLLSGRGGGRELLALDARLPLDPGKLAPPAWFAQDEALSLALDLKALPLAGIATLFLEKPPLLGDLTLDLAATGTPARPTLSADLAVENLAVPREGAPLSAGRIGLELRTREDRLSLAGEYLHPEVRPLAISAALPFHPGDWAAGTRALSEERLEASAKMERSQLAFLAGQVPGIESIVGEIVLDTTVSGTLAAPEVRGTGHLEVSRLRLENRLAPSLRDIELAARFGENRVVLERLRAVVAGGTVEGEGEGSFAPGEEPRLRLALRGEEVLVFRNPEVNLRADLDLRLEGPWSAAALSGEVGLVNSRYFRNFELLPVGLPTRRPASALPTVQRGPRGGGSSYEDLEVGVDLAPFRDWPVSLRIHTKDPFLVRSNLVESDISADLRLVGTLGRPNPVGRVSIREGEMRLPFSRIDVETGRIEFDEATGFNGAIEFKARGRADRYQIAIYLYDRILSPQHVLTSIPPLPSEDIITLLATGTVRSELVGEDVGSLAASKAAGLLLSNLRQKSNRVDGDPTLLDLIEERTELELGRVNPETGMQTFGGKIRLWRQLFFVGNVDAGSDYRALLKYVFRLE